MTVNYLGKDWEVINFLDFAKQVQKFHRPKFAPGWAVGLNKSEINALSEIERAISLKALNDFWRAL